MTDPLVNLTMIDHWFEVPLSRSEASLEAPSSTKITVYGREVRSTDTASADLPWLVYLQGGPGYGAPRPASLSGWLGAAIQQFRVLLLDQRGTGRSNPIDIRTLAELRSPEQQADYLSCFRADAIVADAEFIRTQLSPNRPWTILGQSFGGFCAMSYLSKHPEGLRGVMITGGVPPVGVAIEDVYRATYRRVLERNDRYHQRYPEDAARLAAVRQYLEEHTVTLPGGSTLTTQVLQLLGLGFGFSDGMEPVHYLLENAFIEGPDGPELAFGFLSGVEQALPFDGHLLFSILHEAIYMEAGASNWAAQRVREEFPQFDTAQHAPFQFTGEMIFPWLFDVFVRLRPLRKAAQILAQTDHWPALYDESVLANNTVPTVAAVFAQDMYVEREYSEAVIARIPNCEAWVTNDWDHNALRADPDAQVFNRLVAHLESMQ